MRTRANPKGEKKCKTLKRKKWPWGNKRGKSTKEKKCGVIKKPRKKETSVGGSRQKKEEGKSGYDARGSSGGSTETVYLRDGQGTRGSRCKKVIGMTKK